MDGRASALQLRATARALRQRLALRRAGALWSELQFGRIDVIFNRGLHEYLTEFLTQTDALGQEINRSYFTLS